MPVYDANGNIFTGAVCHRCNTPIKYIFEFEGHIYGSRCIEVVTGIDPKLWVSVDGVYNHEATLKSQEEKAAQREKRIKLEEERLAKVEAVRSYNCEKYAELINVLEDVSRYNGDFCSDMASNIKNTLSSTELYEGIFSPRQYQIVLDIWAKTIGGRQNSKAYKAAEVEFFEKFDPEGLEE